MIQRMADARIEQLERLYRDEGAKLERALVLDTGDPDVAKDARAEAFAQAIRRGDAIRDPRAWVWRTAFRVARGELRARRQMSPLVAEAAYEMPEPLTDLIRALEQLSPKQRASLCSSTTPDTAQARLHGSSGRRRTPSPSTSP